MCGMQIYINFSLHLYHSSHLNRKISFTSWFHDRLLPEARQQLMANWTNYKALRLLDMHSFIFAQFLHSLHFAVAHYYCMQNAFAVLRYLHQQTLEMHYFIPINGWLLTAANTYTQLNTIQISKLRQYKCEHSPHMQIYCMHTHSAHTLAQPREVCTKNEMPSKRQTNK